MGNGHAGKAREIEHQNRHGLEMMRRGGAIFLELVIDRLGHEVEQQPLHPLLFLFQLGAVPLGHLGIGIQHVLRLLFLGGVDTLDQCNQGIRVRQRTQLDPQGYGPAAGVGFDLEAEFAAIGQALGRPLRLQVHNALGQRIVRIAGRRKHLKKAGILVQNCPCCRVHDRDPDVEVLEDLVQIGSVFDKHAFDHPCPS